MRCVQVTHLGHVTCGLPCERGGGHLRRSSIAPSIRSGLPQMGDLHTMQPDGLLPMTGGPRPPNSNTTRGNHQMKTNLLVPSMFIAFLFAFGISVHIDHRATPRNASTLHATTTAPATRITIHYPPIAQAATTCSCPALSCTDALRHENYDVPACMATCSADEGIAQCQCGGCQGRVGDRCSCVRRR